MHDDNKNILNIILKMRSGKSNYTQALFLTFEVNDSSLKNVYINFIDVT